MENRTGLLQAKSPQFVVKKKKEEHRSTVKCRVMIQKNALNIHHITIELHAFSQTCHANVSTSTTCISSLDITMKKVAPVSVPTLVVLLLVRVATVKVQWQEALMLIKGNQLPKSINNSCRICLCVCWLVFYAPVPVILAVFFKITLDFLHRCLRCDYILLIVLMIPCLSWHLMNKNGTLCFIKVSMKAQSSTFFQSFQPYISCSVAGV